MQHPDGSWSNDDPDRPNLTADMEIVGIHPYDDGNGNYLSSKIKGRNEKGKAIRTGRLLRGNDLQIAKLEQPHDFFTHPDLDNYIRGDGGHEAVLYRLTELKADQIARPDEWIFITEGEKDSDTLRSHGLIATTNPNGADKWKPEFSTRLARHKLALVGDNDKRGKDHMQKVSASVSRFAEVVKMLELPGLPERGDVTDWLDQGNTVDDLLELVRLAPVWGSGSGPAGDGEGQSRPASDQFTTNDDGVPYGPSPGSIRPRER